MTEFQRFMSPRFFPAILQVFEAFTHELDRDGQDHIQYRSVKLTIERNRNS